MGNITHGLNSRIVNNINITNHGNNGMAFSKIVGAMQIIVIDRTEFTAPIKTGTTNTKGKFYMPIRKLVEPSGKYGDWLEIDQIKTERVAIDFKKWMLTIDPNHDPFLFLKYDLPLLNAILNNQVSLPYKG